MNEYHSDHQMKDFQPLQEGMLHNWLSPLVTTILKTIKEINKTFVLYSQGIKEMVTRLDVPSTFSQQPNLCHLNIFGQLNKSKESITRMLIEQNEHLNNFKFNLEEQFYKQMKMMMKTNQFKRLINDINQLNDKGIIKTHRLFLNGNYLESIKLSKLNLNLSLRSDINQAIALTNQGMTNEAVKLIDSLLKKYPTNCKIQSKKCIVLLKCRGPTQALHYLESTDLHKQKYLKRYWQIQKSMNKYDALTGISQKIKKKEFLTPSDYINEALGLTEIKRYNEAIKCCDYALNLDSQNPNSYITKAEILTKYKKYNQAIKCCDQAISLEAENSGHYIVKGVIDNQKIAKTLSEMRNYSEAIKCCDFSIAMNPQNSNHYIAKALILSKMKKIDLALFFCDKAINIDQQNTNYNYFKSYLLIKSKQFDEAIKQCDNAIRMDPQYPNHYIQKAKSLKLMNKQDAIIECWNQILSIDSKNPNHYASKAKYLKWMKIYEEAVLFCNLALAMDSKNPNFYIIKSKTLTQLKQYDGAIICCDNAIKLASWETNYYFIKAKNLQYQCKYDEAIKCCDQAIAINPSNPDSFIKKAVSLKQMMKYDEAIKCFNEAISIDSQNPEHYISKAESLKEMRKYEEANQSCTQAITIDSNNPSFYITKALILSEMQRYDETINCCDRAINLDPENSTYYNFKVELLLKISSQKCRSNGVLSYLQSFISKEFSKIPMLKRCNLYATQALCQQAASTDLNCVWGTNCAAFTSCASIAPVSGACPSVKKQACQVSTTDATKCADATAPTAAACSTFSSQALCDANYGRCAWATTCKDFSSCSTADGNQTACGYKSACTYTTADNKCISKTCAAMTTEATCTSVSSFDQKSGTLCAWTSSTTKCADAADTKGLTSATCRTNTQYTYTWDGQNCNKCTSNSYILGLIVALLVLFI